jgi:hypothetical protein
MSNYPSTLLIGRNGQVMAVVPWTKAVDLAYFRSKGMLVVVESFHEEEVRSATMSFKLPSIMFLCEGGRGKKYNPNDRLPLTKKNVFLRDRGICQWCGKKLTMGTMTVDHVFPTSRNGSNTWRNVVASCLPCNNAKDNMTGPEYEQSSGKKLLRRPFTPGREILFQNYKEMDKDGKWSKYLHLHEEKQELAAM